MQITINNVDVQNKGKYQLAVVEYNTADGKTEKKNVVSFTNKALYSTLSTAKQGDVFDVKLGKNDKGYWEFQEATKSQGGSGFSSSGSGKASASPKSTYETPEERAARQVYIIRQSSLSTAAAILTVGAKSVQVDDVIKTAKQLEAYVFGKADESFFEDMPEDIPTIE
jgi:hypothetical protein